VDNVEFCVADAEDMRQQFEEASFNAVTCSLGLM
jgi:ubiquinone/menaquinone biosynthesis C-methylase UbiE